MLDILDTCDPEIRPRRLMELAIVNAVLDDLAGFSLYDSYGMMPLPDNREGQLNEIFSSDEFRLIVKKGALQGSVTFVFGNDGWDAVNDNTTNIEDYLKTSNRLAELLSE